MSLLSSRSLSGSYRSSSSARLAAATPLAWSERSGYSAAFSESGRRLVSAAAVAAAVIARMMLMTFRRFVMLTIVALALVIVVLVSVVRFVGSCNRGSRVMWKRIENGRYRFGGTEGSRRRRHADGSHQHKRRGSQ